MRCGGSADGGLVPIYLFECGACGARNELLLPLGATEDRRCDDCGGTARHRFARVAVRYDSWGFGATDRLVSDTRGKNFGELRETAERISEE
jgi:predicted nucleic acid-binding Zn ribbon protein